MSTVQPTYVNHAHLPGTSRVPSNIEAVLTAALLELANKIDKNKAMHHGASEFSEENTYSAGFFVWHTDASVPENSGLYVCKKDVITPGPWTGSANWTSMNSVSALFTSANTSLGREVRYDLGTAITASATLVDRTINLVQVSSADIDLTLPTARSDGRLRDFLIRIEMAAGATGSPNLVSFTAWEGDDMPTFESGKNYLITLTETKANTWFFKAIELAAKSAPTA